jgi:hypothetical protein
MQKSNSTLVSLKIIPSRIEERCMILLINEELGARFPLVSIEEFLLMLFNEIDLFSLAKTLPIDFDMDRKSNR